MCQYVFHQHSCSDTEHLYPSSWCGERKYSNTMGCIFHRRKATACLWEVSVAGRLLRSRPLATAAAPLLPARGWTPQAQLIPSGRTGHPAPHRRRWQHQLWKKTLHMKKRLKLSSSAPSFLRTQRCRIYTANTFLQAFTVN